MTKSIRIQFKGLIRFSYLGEGGFSNGRLSLEARRKALYAPERLAQRLRLFETLALHALSVQEDAHFSLAILVGEDLPQPVRARLDDLVQHFAQAQIVALPPMSHIRAVTAAYDAVPTDPHASHIATFRLDDDDAMHRASVGRLRHLARGLIPLRDSSTPFAIAFNRGFYFDMTTPERPLREVYERQPLGVGMTLVAPVGSPDTVFRCNHRQISAYFDTYTDVEQPMFLRSVHPGNDSGATPFGRTGRMGPGRIEKTLQEGFGLSLATLKVL